MGGGGGIGIAADYKTTDKHPGGSARHLSNSMLVFVMSSHVRPPDTQDITDNNKFQTRSVWWRIVQDSDARLETILRAQEVTGNISLFCLTQRLNANTVSHIWRQMQPGCVRKGLFFYDRDDLKGERKRKVCTCFVLLLKRLGEKLHGGITGHQHIPEV